MAACSLKISFNALSAKDFVICAWVSFAYATTLVSAPSSSLILELMFFAIYARTSLSISRFSFSAFFLSMAILVSKSGGCISAISPPSKRLLSLSSSVFISLGGRSLDMIICLLASCRALKVWKNSSCVRSFCDINCISSIRRTSIFLYFLRNSSLLSSLIELISSFVNVSHEA